MRKAARRFENRHDVVAFGSVVAMTLPFGITGLCVATYAGMRALDLGGRELAQSWQGMVLLAGALAGFGSGLLLGSILWLCTMKGILPARTVRKWMVGDGGRLGPYAERLFDLFVAQPD